MKLLALALATFFSATALPALAQTAPETAPQAIVGKPAPDFTATDHLGVSHTLSQYKGKNVVLEWTNYGCPFVRKWYDEQDMQKLQAQAKAEGIVWLSIISSAEGKQGYLSAADAPAAVTNEQVNSAAVLLDPTGKIGNLYGAKTTPHMFVVDAEGTLRYAGAIDSIPSFKQTDIGKGENYVMNALAEIKAGKPVTTAETASYGCSVKY